MSRELSRVRVLVADDDFVIASTLSQILRLNGYDAESVASGEEAIEIARRRRPDVLISDVAMSGISGIETAKRVLQINAACIVILISGQANIFNLVPKMDDQRILFEVLNKPIRPEVLLERIAKLRRDRDRRSNNSSQAANADRRRHVQNSIAS